MSKTLLIDYSTSELLLALAEDQKLMWSCRETFSARASAGILSWVLETLAAHHLAPNHIDVWISGIGPGSFTGLRSISAMVLGLARGCTPPRPCFGVPSAIGRPTPHMDLADSPIAVLYDGRNHEFLYYGLCQKEGAWVPSGDNGVIPTVAVNTLNAKFQNFIASETLRPLMPENHGLKIHYSDILNPEALLFSECHESITEPIYLRPAVFVAPKPAREIL